MPVPSRPVTLTTIASAWGQWVHDFTFAPAGCIVNGASALAMLSAGAYRKLNLDNAVSDPGGYLVAASDQLEVPADGGGLYLIQVNADSDNGATSDETNIRLQINGVDRAKDQLAQEGSTAVTLDVTWVGMISAGDIISVRARQVGSGDRADVRITSLTMVRLGDEMGAPTA